ncbi:MAG TPA: hypothetical protein VGH61_08780 [Steroidobacteraceae bacterium]|jgi:hypothetical protein
MTRIPVKLLLATLLATAGSAAHADELYIICNVQPSITAADVRDLFVGEKQFAGAVKLVPIDNSAAQALFLDRILKMTAAKYSVTWIKKSFRDGINPPVVAGSDAEAVATVRRTPGACSYVMTRPEAGLEVIARQ